MDRISDSGSDDASSSLAGCTYFLFFIPLFFYRFIEDEKVS